MKKYLLFAASLLAASVFANAENIKKNEDFHNFGSIHATDKFDVVIVEGSSFSVEYNVDSRIADYCDVHVQSGTLHMEINEKNFPKELKQQLKGKNNADEVKITVTVPAETLQAITLDNNAILNVHGSLTLSKTFTLTANDNSTVKSFSVKGEQVNVVTSKKAGVKADIECKNASVNTQNNSSANIDLLCDNAEIKTEGSSQLVCKADVLSCKSESLAMSKMDIKGTSEKYSVKGNNFANINAKEFECSDVEVNVSSCNCSVHASKNMLLNLQSGAKLVFEGDPVIKIDKIASSSVTRAGDVKKKK